MKTYRPTMIFFIFLISLFVSSMFNPAVAQDRGYLKDFSRMGYFSGTKLSFVLLNDRTMDLFFSGSSKQMVQEKVNAGTCFYILGIAGKNMKMSTSFVVEQDGEKFAGTITNLTNFVDGDIAKGEKISGILQLQKRVKLDHLFTVKGAGGQVYFELSSNALRNVLY
jgi:hypothetical protein